VQRVCVTTVVTVFLRHDGEVLLCRSADTERWDALSCVVGEDERSRVVGEDERSRVGGEDERSRVGGEDERSHVGPESGFRPEAVEVVTERTELSADDTGQLSLVRRGEPIRATDSRTVVPFLFDCERRAAVTPSGDTPAKTTTEAAEWTTPTVIRERAATPGLWDAYRAVAPSVETVAADGTHGSAYISVRALEVVRDTAAVADDWETVATRAAALCDARPEMAAVQNRVDRVLADSDHQPDAVHDRAVSAIERAVAADERAAERAAELIDGPVLTLSRSGTVRATLSRTTGRVYVAESRPGEEGRSVAAALAETRPVTLLPDAAVAAVLAERPVDTVLVGADTIHPDGRVRNKVGTRTAVAAAAEADVPVCVVTARDKVAPGFTDGEVSSSRQSAFETPSGCDAFAPTFDTTPVSAPVVTVVTEDGPVETDGVAAVAAEHARNAAWRRGDSPDDDRE
jgi:translation initiation factor 2B subunit (eIF-2B alpha/beta/delta family)